MAGFQGGLDQECQAKGLGARCGPRAGLGLIKELPPLNCIAMQAPAPALSTQPVYPNTQVVYWLCEPPCSMWALCKLLFPPCRALFPLSICADIQHPMMSQQYRTGGEGNGRWGKLVFIPVDAAVRWCELYRHELPFQNAFSGLRRASIPGGNSDVLILVAFRHRWPFSRGRGRGKRTSRRTLCGG